MLGNCFVHILTRKYILLSFIFTKNRLLCTNKVSQGNDIFIEKIFKKYSIFYFIGSPCEHGGTCVNTPGSYRCDCPKGFKGSRCEININECENNPCLNQGTCIDERGGFRCICMPGKWFSFS